MATTIDTKEIHIFEEVAAQWWDPEGPFKPLHQLNPVRIRYILEACHKHKPSSSLAIKLENYDILDIGCGGGLASEALALLDANVTGIDAGAEAIQTASAHAVSQGLSITYRLGEARDLHAEGRHYDVITALEVVEHVSDVSQFIKDAAMLLKPGGLLILSTLNRTIASYGLGIIAAEYILKWAPKGTHQWTKFLKPSELAHSIRQAGLTVEDVKGLSFNPLMRQWSLSSHLDINYFMVAKQRG